MVMFIMGVSLVDEAMNYRKDSLKRLLLKIVGVYVLAIYFIPLHEMGHYVILEIVGANPFFAFCGINPCVMFYGDIGALAFIAVSMTGNF